MKTSRAHPVYANALQALDGFNHTSRSRAISILSWMMEKNKNPLQKTSNQFKAPKQVMLSPTRAYNMDSSCMLIHYKPSMG